MMTDKDRYLAHWGYAIGTPEAEAAWQEKQAMTIRQAPYVVADIRPYRSMMTGEMIEGRRDHRNHLRTHGVVEVGNDKSIYSNQPKDIHAGLKEQIAHQVYEKLRY